MSDDAIKKFVEDLFTSGSGERAHRLVLTTTGGRNVGGWSKQAVIDRLREAATKESPRAR